MKLYEESVFLEGLLHRSIGNMLQGPAYPSHNLILFSRLYSGLSIEKAHSLLLLRAQGPWKNVYGQNSTSFKKRQLTNTSL